LNPNTLMIMCISAAEKMTMPLLGELLRFLKLLDK